MTREEFKAHVNTISGLVIDIAELNMLDDDHPAVSLTVSGINGATSVCVIYNKPKRTVKHYTINPDGSYFDNAEPEDVIRELEEIKAFLEKEKDPVSGNSDGSNA